MLSFYKHCDAHFIRAGNICNGTGSPIHRLFHHWSLVYSGGLIVSGTKERSFRVKLGGIQIDELVGTPTPDCQETRPTGRTCIPFGGSSTINKVKICVYLTNREYFDDSSFK